MKTQNATENPLVGRGGGNANKLQSSISKRRNIMTTQSSFNKTFHRYLGLLLVVVLATGMVFGQNVRNKGTFINASPMSVRNFNNGHGAGAANNRGTLINYSTITFTSAGSFFNYDSVGAQVSGTGTVYNYGSTINSSTGTMNGAYSIDVSNGQLLNDTAGTVNAGGSIQLKSPSGITNGTGTITTAIGTIEYNGNGAQSIYNTTYGILKLNTGATNATKTLSNNVTVNTQVLFAVTGGGTLTLDEAGKTLTLYGATPFSGVGTFLASGAGSTTIYALANSQSVYGASYYNLQINGGASSTKTAGGGVTIVAGGSLSVAASTTLDMAANTLTSIPAAVGTITNAGTIQSGGNVSFGGTYTIGSSFKYNGGAAQNIGTANYSSLDLSGVGGKTFPATVGVSGAYTVQGGTGARTYALNTFTYNGTSAQTVLGGESYNNVTIASATDTSAANYKTASAAFTVAGTLTINAGNTLDMGSYAASTFAAGSNNGKIRWSFNNVYVAGAGTTELYTSNAGNLAAGANYGNIWITGTNKTVPAGVAVTATGGADAAFGVTVAGSLTVAATGSLTVTSMDLNNDGTITNNGSITVN